MHRSTCFCNSLCLSTSGATMGQMFPMRQCVGNLVASLLLVAMPGAPSSVLAPRLNTWTYGCVVQMWSIQVGARPEGRKAGRMLNRAPLSIFAAKVNNLLRYSAVCMSETLLVTAVVAVLCLKVCTSSSEPICGIEESGPTTCLLSQFWQELLTLQRIGLY